MEKSKFLLKPILAGRPVFSILDFSEFDALSTDNIAASTLSFLFLLFLLFRTDVTALSYSMHVLGIVYATTNVHLENYRYTKESG